MNEFYTNLPQKDKDNFQKTIDRLKTKNYVENFQFNQNDYDAAISFFVKRGFDRQPAEETAYVILQQARIDNISSQAILDILTDASPVVLSELVTVILNANRYKSSRLGVRKQRSVDSFVSKNVVD